MSRKEVGFLAAGIGLGTAVALLYAPRSGKVTRRYVRSKANSGVRYVREQGEQLKSAAIDRFERGKKGLLDAKSHIAAAVEAGKEAYNDARTM
jgi:gas vesicle protein